MKERKKERKLQHNVRFKPFLMCTKTSEFCRFLTNPNSKLATLGK